MTPDDQLNPFKAERAGTLVEQDPESGEYSIWFPYTSEIVQVVRKGSFVAVENFDSLSGSSKNYSLLEIMEAHPTHYALEGTGTSVRSSYPGFVVEAAKSAKHDWEQDEPTEHTTVIDCTATRSGRELVVEDDASASIEDEDALPKIGEDAQLVSNEMMSEIINEGLLETERDTISPGSLRLDEDIPYYLDVESLLRTHFGVFGFTGAGKSNALSNIISHILAEGTNETLVLPDLMGEYTGLLIDLVDRYDNARIIATDPDSLPGGEATEAYLQGDEGMLDRAKERIIRQLLLPDELRSIQHAYEPVLDNVLRDGKIQLLSQEGVTIEDVLEEFDNFSSQDSASRQNLRLRLEDLMPDGGDDLDSGDIQLLIDDVERVLEHGEVPNDPDDWGAQGQIAGQDTVPRFSSDNTSDITTAEEADIRQFLRYLEDLGESLSTDTPQRISRGEIMEMMDSEEPTLIILQSDYGDDLKDQARRLMNWKYQQRRRTGGSRPLVTFILDEADEFIPADTSDNATIRIRGAIETIARRGRKFGIGIGIATQRATYLDTNIMAQPHTYMVSQLPREADRDRVGEAFGLQEEVLDRTLEFNTGEWLMVSYEASGIEGFPIPVSFKNANERVREYFEQHI